MFDKKKMSITMVIMVWVIFLALCRSDPSDYEQPITVINIFKL